jgi:hypothetical protein
MVKGFIAWNSSATDKTMNPGIGYTIGVGIYQYLHNDNFAVKTAGGVDADNGTSGFTFYS